MTVINIAQEFSSRPIGRYDPADGKYSGERFRKKFLVPALKQSTEKIKIDLDGLKMLTSSFMEEAFGGLIRREGFNSEEILERLEFNYSDPFDDNYVTEIINDIKEARLENLDA